MQGLYHGTGMVVGKAGRSLTTGLKHDSNRSSSKLVPALGNCSNHPRRVENDASASASDYVGTCCRSDLVLLTSQGPHKDINLSSYSTT